MRLLVLMAGDGRLFEVGGASYPKNLVEIDGEPLVQRVVENLRTVIEAATESIFMVREEEQRRHHTGDVISLLVPDARVMTVPATTSGAACTALHAVAHVRRDEPLLICNGDQVLDADLQTITQRFEAEGRDAGVITFDAVHPRWSYVRTDDTGLVVEAAEKRPISRLATAGVYWFARGGDFLDGAMSMIRKDASIDGVFYVCPVLNEVILAGGHIGTHHIERGSYHSLASLHGVDSYEQHVTQLRRMVAA